MIRKFVLASGLVFLAVGVIAGIFLTTKAEAYRQARQGYSEGLMVTKRLVNPEEWVGDASSLPYLTDHSARKENWLTLRQNSLRYSLYLGIGMAIVLGTWLWGFPQKTRFQENLLGLHIAALVCLAIGVCMPMLEIAAYESEFSLKDLPIKAKLFGSQITVSYSRTFPGDLYFFYQSKSAWQLIISLLMQKNYIVGISLLLFSIIFPLVKTMYTASLLFRSSLPTANTKSRLLQLGKWSMADVFVVSVFLGYLAFGNMQVGIPTESKVLPGLYFFMAYCILSIWISQLIQKQQIAQTHDP